MSTVDEKLVGTNFTKPLRKFVQDNESVLRLAERMILREGKSTETLRRYVGGIITFTAFMGSKNADSALEALRKSSDPTQKIDDFITFLISKKYSPINVKALWHGLRKWLLANRVNGIDWEFVTRPKVSSNIRDRIPTKDELRRILIERATLRDRAFFLTAATSGLRIGTLATLQVKDYSHYEELGKLTVEGAPRRKLAKGQSYFTFIPPETRQILDDYLESRGNIQSDQPLFVKSTGEPMSVYASHIARQWNRLIEHANLAAKIVNHRYPELHVHVLRKFFQTSLKLSSVQSSFVDYFMGHHPTNGENYLDGSYFRPSIEAAAREYRKAIPSLTIWESNLITKQVTEEMQDLRSQVNNLTEIIMAGVQLGAFQAGQKLSPETLEGLRKHLKTAKIEKSEPHA